MARGATIETPRLRIEPFDDRFLTDAYVSWLNDPEVVRFSDQRFRTHTRATCRDYARTFEASADYFWALVRRDGGEHVGTMTAYVDVHHAVADIGVLIGEVAAMGQGYASEAWLGVCDYLLRDLGLRKVTAGTIAPNVGMIRVMDKAGMVDDGRRVRHHLWNGEQVDVIHRAAFRETWVARFPRPPYGTGGPDPGPGTT